MLNPDALRALAARYLSADPSYRLAREALAAANEIERLRAALAQYTYCPHAIPDCYCTAHARREYLMRSAETHPTPQYVLDAVHVVAGWLREIDAVEALISQDGGASWHGERQADRLLAGWQEAEGRADRAQAEMFRLLQRNYDYTEMQNVIHILLEGLDEHWMSSGEGHAAVARAKRFLEAHNG